WWRRARIESAAELQCDCGKLLLVSAAPAPVSSTQVRARIAAGGDASDLLPRGVWDYICARGLYRAGAA
ncbi:MAG: nicotinate-nicotinamide nucleotide adenylyltransferase, partial [Gammaproteobacteria bacterium]